MSCRIIGRNLEFAFVDFIVDKLKKVSVKVIKAKYIKTKKNSQVKEFYEKCSFKLQDTYDSIRNYTLNINNYKPKKLKYIKVVNEK